MIRYQARAQPVRDARTSEIEDDDLLDSRGYRTDSVPPKVSRKCRSRTGYPEPQS